MSFTAILANRHMLFMKGMKICIHKELPDAEILYEFDNFNDLIPTLENVQPDILVIDYCLKDGQLIDHLAGIRVNYPNIKILVCTMKFSLSTMLRYLGMIDGFIGKHFESIEIAHACQKLLKGNTFMAIAKEI